MAGSLTGGYLGLVFDGALALLLTATIVYAAILNRKLTDLRGAKQDMERLLAGFAKSTDRADASLRVLRDAAGEIGDRLQEGIIKGNAVADDLMFLIERAGPLADRLETARAPGGKPGGRGRGENPPRAGAEPDPAEVPPSVRSSGSDGPESAFIEALRGVR